MGIESELPAVPSLTLGTADVTPIEMASAYQTLANDGKHCEPYTVTKVVDAGGVLYRHKPVCKQVVAPEIAHLVTAMLQGVVSGGTGTAAALGSWPVAGKTGTTQDYTNAWFVGYTRQVSTAVWVGFPGTPDSLSLYFGGRCSAARSPRRSGTTTCCGSWPGCRPRASRRRRRPSRGRCPTWSGSESEHAQNVLAKANFTPLVEVVDSAEPKGTVVAQTPAGGASARAGRIVTIQVSSGVPSKVKVPDVVGMSQADAKTALEAAGFVVEVVSKHVSDPHNVDLVLDQQPMGGNQAPAGQHGHHHGGLERYGHAVSEPGAQPEPRAVIDQRVETGQLSLRRSSTFCCTRVPST